MPLSAAAQAQSSAGLPPKARAFLMVSAYGAASGAILGLASMAFGNSTRAIAQGASLGLYAGILFGSYILISHNYRTQRPTYDGSTPYQDGGDDYDDYGEEPKAEGGGGFFDSGVRRDFSGNVVADATSYRRFETKKGSTGVPPIQMTLLKLNF